MKTNGSKAFDGKLDITGNVAVIVLRFPLSCGMNSCTQLGRYPSLPPGEWGFSMVMWSKGGIAETPVNWKKMRRHGLTRRRRYPPLHPWTPSRPLQNHLPLLSLPNHPSSNPPLSPHSRQCPIAPDLLQLLLGCH